MCEEAPWHPGGFPGEGLVLRVVTDSRAGLWLASLETQVFPVRPEERRILRKEVFTVG